MSTPRPKISLDGTWNFSYDPDGVGLSESWFSPAKVLPETTMVPGCAQVEAHESAGAYDRLTDVEIPELSDTVMLRYGCKHDAWMQKKFAIAADWRGQKVFLHVGGVKPAGEFWLNGIRLGDITTSRCAVRCDVTEFIRFGEENTLTVRVHWPQVRLFGVFDIWHAWSGIYRSAWLEAVPSTHLADIHVVTSIDPPAAKINLVVRGAKNQNLRAVCEIHSAGASIEYSAEYSGAAKIETSEIALDIPMPDAKLWSINAPNLYRATVRIFDGEEVFEEGSVRFGLREISTDGFQVLLNGTPIFLRGGCDDQIYPDTVCPPCDKEFFRERIRKAKEYGFNYTKSAVEIFTEEYLQAADELGYLVCIEMPFAALGEARDIRNDPPPELADLWRRELDHIVRFTRSHASVAVYSMNSETPVDHENPAAFDLFSREFPASVRRLNPSALVIDVTAALHPDVHTRHGERDTDFLEDCVNNHFTAQPLHGLLEIADTVTKPFLLHEWDWITSLPNPSIAKRYETLALVPVQVAEMIEAARATEVLDELPAMFEASHKLKLTLRKDALELAFEHPKIAGYHHWLIHDVVYCPEGVFNEFWEEQPGMNAEEFRTYNGDTVLVLDDRDTRSFHYETAVPLGITVAHFGSALVRDGVLKWQLKRGEEVLKTGAQNVGEVACGARKNVSSLGIGAVEKSTPAQLELLCELWDGGEKVSWNHWPLWFFPRAGKLAPGVLATQPLPKNFGVTRKPFDPLAPPMNSELSLNVPISDVEVFVTHRLTDNIGEPIENLFEFIERGGRVLLLSQGALQETQSLFYRSVPYNMGRVGNMGTLIHPHPALGDFPHEGWCDLHFVEMIEGAYPLRLDVFGQKIRPIIRSIGHHMTMPDKGYLFEVGIGKGTLLACSLNLQPHCHLHPAAEYLLWSFINYLAAGNCAPEVKMTTEQFINAMPERRKNAH